VTQVITVQLDEDALLPCPRIRGQDIIQLSPAHHVEPEIPDAVRLELHLQAHAQQDGLHHFVLNGRIQAEHIMQVLFSEDEGGIEAQVQVLPYLEVAEESQAETIAVQGLDQQGAVVGEKFIGMLQLV